MDPVKVVGVAEWPEPCNKQEVQSFLGFPNVYHQSIKEFSHHDWLLFNLTENKQKWQWSSSEASAFWKLKELVTSTPVLTTPADDQPFRIEADSLDFAIGVVLSQLSAEDVKWHPVAYYSKSLMETERNYKIHNKEMLAIIWALDEWQQFLEGAPWKFEIWTDHKNLEYFMLAKKLNHWQACWCSTDQVKLWESWTLSRQANHRSGSDDNQDITLLTPNFFAVQATEELEVMGKERDLLRLIQRETKSEELKDTVTQSIKALTAHSIHSSEWSEVDGVLYFHGKIYVPPTADIRQKIVALHHNSHITGHPGRWKTLQLVARNYWWPHIMVHQSIHCHLWLVPLDQNPETAVNWSLGVAPNSWHPMGHCKCRLHSWTSGVRWIWCNYGGGRLPLQKSSLPSSKHDHHSSRVCTAVLGQCVEASWTSGPPFIRPRPSVYRRIHNWALLTTGHQSCQNYCISSAGRRPNRMGELGAQTVPLIVY